MLNYKEQMFIERFGFFFEKSSNFPRIAGKIFAYFLICDPPEQTQQQIIEVLGIARGSASTILRMLNQSQIIDEFTKPGIRPKFYKLKNSGWENLFFTKLQNMSVVLELLKEGRLLIDKKTPGATERIDEMANLYTFFKMELPALISKWKKFNLGKGRPNDR